MKNTILLSALALTLIFTGCKKKDECNAGTGGSVAIVAYANYSGTNLINYQSHPDTAFVKFGTTTSPGTNPSNYDIYFVSEAGEDHVHCEGLTCGDYYVYRTAWDSVANKTYYGGYGLSFSENTGEQDIIITVN